MARFNEAESVSWVLNLAASLWIVQEEVCEIIDLTNKQMSDWNLKEPPSAKRGQEMPLSPVLMSSPGCLWKMQMNHESQGSRERKHTHALSAGCLPGRVSGG